MRKILYCILLTFHFASSQNARDLAFDLQSDIPTKIWLQNIVLLYENKIDFYYNQNACVEALFYTWNTNEQIYKYDSLAPDSILLQNSAWLFASSNYCNENGNMVCSKNSNTYDKFQQPLNEYFYDEKCNLTRSTQYTCTCPYASGVGNGKSPCPMALTYERVLNYDAIGNIIYEYANNCGWSGGCSTTSFCTPSYEIHYKYKYPLRHKLAEKTERQYSNYFTISKTVYDYDADSNLTSVLAYDSLITGTNIRLTSKQQLNYDTSGNLLDSLYTVWDINNNQWVNVEKKTKVYDRRQNMVKESRFIWSNSQNDWINNYYQELIFDTSLTSTTIFYPYNWSKLFHDKLLQKTVGNYVDDSSWNMQKYLYFYSEKPLVAGISSENQYPSKFSVYPNPTNNYVYISGADLNFKIQLSDLLGNEITCKLEANKLDVNDLPVGIYLLHVEGKDGQQVFKIVKR